MIFSKCYVRKNEDFKRTTVCSVLIHLKKFTESKIQKSSLKIVINDVKYGNYYKNKIIKLLWIVKFLFALFYA